MYSGGWGKLICQRESEWELAANCTSHKRPLLYLVENTHHRTEKVFHEGFQIRPLCLI